MSRIVVIGATGHVGTYLVPRLVRAGHEVVALSRGEREPYVPAPEWRAVERVTADREAEDAAGAFGERIAALAPDAVVDMVCFTPESAEPAAGRAAACPAAAAALRQHLGPRPGRAGAGHRGRAAHRLRRVRDRQGGDRGAPAARDGRRRGAERRAASRPHQRPLAVHHAGGQPRPRRLAAPGRRRAARPAGARARRAAPRARGRRRAGLRARAHPPRRDRVELPRRLRAGDDAARPRRGGGRVVRPRAGARVRRVGGVRAPRRRRATPRRPASTSPAASPRASTGPARSSATARGSAHSTPCASRSAGSRPTATSTSAASSSNRARSCRGRVVPSR